MSIEEQTIWASNTGIGDGTEENPYSLPDALSNLEAGTTLRLKAGTYSDVSMNISASASSTNPIYIKPEVGAHVIIDSVDDFILSGNDVIIDGAGGLLEIMTDSWTGDRFLTSQHFDVGIYGSRSKILNCWVHDFGNIGDWSPGVNSEIKGCLIYNIGRGNGSLGHPHYTQNNIGTKLIEENIFIQTFESTFINHQYGTGSSVLKGYRYRNNIYVNGRWLAGSGGSQVVDTYLQFCEFIGAPVEIGLLGPMSDPEHEDFRIEDNNLFDSPITIKNGKNYRIKRNAITHTLTAFLNVSNGAAEGIDINANNYVMYGTVPFNKWGFPAGATSYPNLAAFQAGTSQEADGTYVEYNGDVPPDSQRVIPHTNATDRASVRIANYSESASVDIDLSSVTGLVNGVVYRLYNAQNPSEYHEFVHDGNPVTVSMDAGDWTVSIPIGTEGGVMTPEASLFPKYGVFYLMKAV